MRFAKPLPLSDAAVIKKLAAAAPSSTHALLVEQVDQVPSVVGTFKMRRGMEIAVPGTALDVPFAGSKGLAICIVGPANLQVGGPHPLLTLDGGRLRSDYVRVANYPKVEDIFGAITKELFTPLGGGIDKTFPDRLDGWNLLTYCVTSTWQRIVDGVKRRRHGGAFAFVTPASEIDIRRKYDLEVLALGERLRALWNASFDQNAPISHDAYRHWNKARVRVNAAIESIVGMSAVDGCVLMDFSLNVLGFGAKMVAPPYDPAKTPDLTFVRADNGQPDVHLLERVHAFGTRHLSAFHLCCAHVGTMVFVISEDGDVRIFLHDNGGVSMIDCKNTVELSDAIRLSNAHMAS